MEHSNLLDEVMLTLARHKIGDIVALKGGYMLNKLLASRATADIDFSIGNLAVWSNLEKILIDCGEELKTHRLITNYSIQQPSLEPARSGGAEYRVGENAQVVAIDVSVQDLKFGIAPIKFVVYGYSVATSIEMDGYTFERVLGDKLSATFSKIQFRRTKDLFDIYCIITTQQLAYMELFKALKDRHCLYIINQDGEEPEFSPFTKSAIVNWQAAWDKLRLNRGMGKSVEKPELKIVLEKYNEFIFESRGLQSKLEDIIWSPQQMKWVQKE